MRVSCNWLSRHVDLAGVDLMALGRRFTMAVAELDGVERIGFELERVVVGKVLAVQGLEGKKVRLTSVDCGAHGVRAIICGAPNVEAGQHVAVALPGQKLGDMEIAVAEVAGVVSHGMICSERELGLSDEHAGILTLDGAPAPGTPLAEVLPGLTDTIFVIDNKSLTHRPDCWGHRGIAREVAALVGRPLQPLAGAEVVFGAERPLTIEVRDAAACPRYSATTLDGVSIARSPLWLRLLLQRVGTRPINNIVDATNFAMLDTGNPLHAFDRRQIRGDRIVVRAAAEGERFATLDGQERVLAAHDLVIADATRAVALAGVMGGLDSEIKDDTSEVVLEAANFDAARVRMTAQRLGLRTESSARFEKSLDPRAVDDGARVFLALVQSLCPGARVTSAFMDAAAPYPAPTTITLDVAYAQERLGFPVARERMVEILRGLEFGVEGDERLTVTVPTWRATKDIAIPEDLVEEVGRIFGYDNIPPAAPLVPVVQPDRNAKKKFERVVREVLAASAGLDEVQTYSFDDDVFLGRIGVTPPARVRLRNAISVEQPCLRTALAPLLLKVLDTNARGYASLGVFELGRVFTLRSGGALPEQPTTLGVLIAGSDERGGAPGASWFARGKGLLQGLASALERGMPDLLPGRVAHAYAHPVRQAALALEGREVGFLAEIHPLVLHKLGVRHTGVLLELDLDALRASPVVPMRYRPLPRFPAVFRDFAVLIDKSVPAGVVGRAIAEADTALISEVVFQSAWSGPGIGAHEKSLAWSVTMRHAERTLNDAEAREVEGRVWAAVAAVGGRPRA